MTLTHILPSLRRSLPDPLSRDCWPEYTTTTPDDVTIAGLSLVTLVQWCGTPCVTHCSRSNPGHERAPLRDGVGVGRRGAGHFRHDRERPT